MRWRQIEDYPNYLVSDYGNIKTLNYNHTKEERAIQHFVNYYGYMACNLMCNGQRKRFLVHRLVAMAFHHDTYFEGATVNHKDGNKQNNYYKNLEWMTPEDNLKHGHKNGLVKYSNGQSHYRAKLSSSDIAHVRKLLSIGIKGREIASLKNVSEKYISAIKTNRSRKYE